MRDDFFIWLEKQEKALTAASILAQVTRLRQINVLPVANFYIKDEDGNIIETIKLDVRDSSKIDEAVDIIMAANDQCVVFSNFNEPMEELADRLRQWGFNAKIISSKYRQEMANYEEDFQQQRIDVLLLNSSMGEGLNLQKDPEKWPGGARVGIALDKWWNNARNDQCIKRIHRPGGKEAVFFYNLYVEHSIDMWINQLCDEKDAEFAAVMDSGEIRPASYWKEHLEGMF
jgi:SNF2 family DNA or RNA helicase